jgi:hypothetical protein
VSSNFIDEVAALAELVNGDDRGVVKALHDGEVNRFRSGKANELETYIVENDHIEPRDTLNHGQIRVRIIERFIDGDVSHGEAK